ncbi:hypothetical protein BDW42DRAFT_121762 [Aspergillus taichungensis]|uniref:Uncharacterized protein n=1 Tax=Aspergillus taichungensis TaxID=482145 RepID=A0A2J5I7M9_9EURO|nr:hypothetical protein BDW42DRAFT_121762 [Aspergillus taichungensis]
MATYLSLPAFQELIEFVERDSVYEDSVKALAVSMLSYHFPIVNGWIIAPEQNRNDRFADFIVLRVQRRFPGDRSVIDHTVAEAKKGSDNLDAAMEQIENALEHANTEFGRCWAIVFHGLDILFYEYHKYLPANSRLIPTGPPSQPHTNRFHVRTDSLSVQEMLTHMLQHETPNPR